MSDIVERLRNADDKLERIYVDFDFSGLLSDAADEIERLRAAQAWQPIETAPKDRLLLLHCKPKNRTWVGANRQSSWPCDDSDLPTHWMPLPSPPEADT